MSGKKKRKANTIQRSFIGEAKEIFATTLRFFRVYPISLLPLLLCWGIYAATILYMEYYFDWNTYPQWINCLIVFGCIVAFCTIYGIACLILLELIQQIETGEKLCIGRATFDAFSRDFWKSLPLLLIWAILWFVLALLETLFSKRKEKETERELSARSAVGTLLGDGGSFGWSAAFFSALSKGIRMTVFLMLPAIAWENLGTLKSFKKGLKILKDVKESFVVAYGATGVFAALVMLIPGLIYYADAKLELNLPETVWYGVLIYMAFAASLSLLVEQLYMAQLYLWHMLWEKQKTTKKFGTTMKPSFFDKVNSL